MDNLNRNISFFCILLGSLVWASWMHGHVLAVGVRNKMISSLSMVVYLDGQASGGDIQNIKKILEGRKEVSIRSFVSSVQAYENLKQDSEISKQLKAMEQDFILPASFELSIHTLDAGEMRRIVAEIRSYHMVEEVEAPFEAIENSRNLLRKLNKLLIISAAGVFGAGLFIFYVSGYLYFLFDYKKILLARETGACNMRTLKHGFYRLLYIGVISGLFSLVLLYVAGLVSEVRFGFEWWKIVCFISGVSFLPGIFYRLVSVLNEKNSLY